MLPHSWEIMELMNKTIIQPTMSHRTDHVHVMHSINSPELCIERRTFAWYYSALPVRLTVLGLVSDCLSLFHRLVGTHMERTDVYMTILTLD